MSNVPAIQTFGNSELGEIRITDQNGEPWFVLKDILTALKSSTRPADAKDSIQEVFGDGFNKVIPIQDSLGRMQDTTIINEPATTYLVAQSRTETGKKLNRWIHAEVLPAIRKTGKYSILNLEGTISSFCENLMEKGGDRFPNIGADKRIQKIHQNGNEWRVAILLKGLPKMDERYFGRVYAFEYDGLLKIGCTQNLLARIKQLKSMSNNYGVGGTGTVVFSGPHTNFRENEKILHSFFSQNRNGKSELFKLTIDQFIQDSPRCHLKNDSTSLNKKAEDFTESIKSFITSGSTKGLFRTAHPSPTHSQQYLTPSEIGERLGGLSEEEANKLFVDKGFQVACRNAEGQLTYRPTRKGKPYAILYKA